MATTLKKQIDILSSDPRKLFWFYVILHMVPTILLITSEPFNLFGKLVLLLFPLGTYMMILSVFRNTGLIQLILFPLFIIHAFQLVLFYLYGEDVIAVDMFLNLVTTNPSEAGELLGSIWPSIIIVCVLYIPATIIAIIQLKRKVYLPFVFRKKTLLAGAVIFCCSFIFSLFAKDKNVDEFSFYKDVYPANVFYNLDFAIHKWQNTRNYPETSKDFSFHARKELNPGQREIYVFVIGETGRAENWSLYGYPRRTNPKLEEQDGLIHFEDVLTQSNTTHKSVAIMLSAASAENYDVIYTQKSILEAFKETGFKTVFLSNQGANHSFTDFYSNEADYYRNIRSIGELGISTVNQYDDALLPMFRHCIDSIPGNLLVVFHTYGSHFNYNERYPESFSQFTPDEVTKISQKEREMLVNAYDNTILYTDYFLSEVIDILEEQQCYSAMFYASDHGEDIMDDKRGRFLHASPNPTFYQLRIPMLTWFSDNYRAHSPEKVEAAGRNRLKPIATNAVFHTLLDIASIRTEHLIPELSLVDTLFQTDKRMYLNDHDKPIFFYHANLKKEDKIMIDERNVYH